MIQCFAVSAMIALDGSQLSREYYLRTKTEDLLPVVSNTLAALGSELWRGVHSFKRPHNAMMFNAVSVHEEIELESQSSGVTSGLFQLKTAVM